MKKVMVFGTFDILHPGHIHMLKEASEYGDFLITVLAKDKVVEKIKRHKPLHNEKTRVSNMKQAGIANKVRLGYINDKYKVIKEEKPDIIALGYDQKVFVDKLTDVIEDHVQIVRLAPFKPEIYKSSKMKEGDLII